jgi:hypothetical protein
MKHNQNDLQGKKLKYEKKPSPSEQDPNAIITDHVPITSPSLLNGNCNSNNADADADAGEKKKEKPKGIKKKSPHVNEKKK